MNGAKDRVIDGLNLHCTCGGCPEQYEVFDGDEQVAYLRLRHGEFTAEVPDCGGEIVYESDTLGDGWFDADERLPQLNAAIRAVRKSMGG